MNPFIQQITEQVNEALNKINYPGNVKNLYEPIQYSLDGGGKRIRPVLMMIAYSLFRPDYHKIINQAIALEVYHNFTLLHDDVMDKADMRRGKPCVHVKWDENTAILSGDAMLVMAYKLMTSDFINGKSDVSANAFAKALHTFNDATLGVCEGQQFDMDFENCDSVDEHQYMEMIRLKTSLLLASALKIGAQLADADEKDSQLLYDFGEKLGLAFQLQDDLLDVYGDPKVFGKNIGGDIAENKKTFILIKTLELADDKQRETLYKWIALKDFDRNEKITAFKSVYQEVNIKKICQQKIQSLFDDALDILNNVNADEKKKLNLLDFASSLMNRNY